MYLLCTAQKGKAMSNPNNVDWSAMTGPLLELQKINQKASEELIRETISFCSDNTGSALKYTQTTPRATNPEDLLGIQVKLFAQQGEKVFEYAKNVFEIYQNTFKEQLEWSEGQFSTAVKTASLKAKKAGEAV